MQLLANSLLDALDGSLWSSCICWL